MTDSEAVPFQFAVRRLCEWLEIVARSQRERPQNSSHVNPPVKALRSQVQIKLGPDVSLAWLRAQPHVQKLYFRSRDDSFEIAAVGFAYVSSGPTYTKQTHLRLISILNPQYPQMKFYGASRFDPSADRIISPEWEPFSGFTYVLPAVEVYRDCEGHFCLAANCYPPAGTTATLEALAMLQPLTLSTQTARHSSLIPRAFEAFDAPGFDSWNAAMKRVLSDLERKEYQKIVLTHRKKFVFQRSTTLDPIHILAALDEANRVRNTDSSRTAYDRYSVAKHTSGKQSTSKSFSLEISEGISEESCDVQRSYLFCLQVSVGKAFLSRTPEMLFRLEGRDLKTEALAGTVRRGSDEQEAMELEQLLNKKNMDEHGYVVQHITDILTECKADIQASGPFVRKLARLMHLVTKIDGRFPSSFQDVSDKAYEVLSRMHPTPAVCGLPREKTQAEIRELEGFDRGLFAGPLGWFSTEAAEFCVAIRSAVLQDNELTAFAGSGIVAGSEIKSEWDETELKMSALPDLFSVMSGGAPPFVNCMKKLHSENRVKENFHDLKSKVNLINQKSTEMDKYPPLEHTRRRSIHLSRMSLSCQNVRSDLSGLTSDSETAEVNPQRQKGTDASALHLLPNLNALWALCCIEELCRNGVDTFFIAPGSRSAPLAVAAVTSRHARYFVCHDERGAGFLAIGFARATSRAAAVITTSGTAVANLLPAAVEATTDSLPLILLTADRPPELRDVGANQTINQVGVFGTHVLWSTDVPCPTEKVPLRYILKNVDLAVRMCGSSTRSRELCHSTFPRGPVHINMMFRENLSPDYQDWDREYLTTVGSRWCHSLDPAIRYGIANSVPRRVPNSWQQGLFSLYQESSSLLWDLKNQKNGVIIVGGGSGSIHTEDEAIAVCEIAKFLDWPVISDICGGVRLCGELPKLIHYADLLLCSALSKSHMSFTAVLQFGERITSKKLLNFIRDCSRADENFVHVLVSPSLRPSDPSLTVTHRIEGRIPTFLSLVEECIAKNRMFEGGSSFDTGGMNEIQVCTDSICGKMGTLRQLSESMDELLNMLISPKNEGPLTEPSCARIITQSLPVPSALFIGNSMPIRDFDCFAVPRTEGSKLRVAANRGASGIDGLVCSGIGFGIGVNLDVTVVVGDMSMIHDLNALHLLREEDNSIPVKVTVVVINNGGGGIFSMLPIAKHKDILSPVFDTAHGVGFEHACSMFGIDYIHARTNSDLQSAISRSSKKHRVIEASVPKDHGLNAIIHKSIMKFVDEKLMSISQPILS